MSSAPTTVADPIPTSTVVYGMESRSGLAIDLLLVALMMGVLGNFFLRSVPLGINVFLWVAILLIEAAALARRHGVALRGEGRWMALPILFFAGAMGWRDADSLMLFNGLALTTALALGALRLRGGRLRIAGVGWYVKGLLLCAMEVLLGSIPLLRRDIRWERLGFRGIRARHAAALRGIVIALPLLWVFGALFAAADPVFGRGVRFLFHWDGSALWETLFWIGCWSWVSAGLLRQALLEEGSVGRARLLPTGVVQRVSLGATEIGIVLGVLNALFLAFVGVQFRYLFGGAELVQGWAGMSYAEYARRGFFELVAVGALVLPLLLGLHACLPAEGAEGTEGKEQRRFRRFAGALLVLLAVVMASALRRMQLYQAEYGLTELRLYATVFMGWLVLVFCWFAATVLRGQRLRFAWGATVAGFGVLALLDLANPHALIVRVNTEHALTSGRFDRDYLVSLSADAVPALVESLPHLRPRTRCELAWRMGAEGWETEGADWRSWNWGRARAREVLEKYEEDIRRFRCVPGVQPTAETPGGGTKARFMQTGEGGVPGSAPLAPEAR